MKCEVCLELLEEYLDGELAVEDHEQINAHLVTCSECSESFVALMAEQELLCVTIGRPKYHRSCGPESQHTPLRRVMSQHAVGSRLCLENHRWLVRSQCR